MQGRRGRTAGALLSLLGPVSRLLRRSRTAEPEAPLEVPVELFDREWYLRTNADVAASGIEPWRHFLLHGLMEGRSPSPLFDGHWYLRRNEDVAQAGSLALLHYLRYGAAEGRDPHPGFDAAWYSLEHPEAAANPLLHYIRNGRHRGWPTQKRIDPADYRPSQRTTPIPSAALVVDIVIPVYRGLDETRCCIESVIADRDRPAGAVIVVDDCTPEPELGRWLDAMAATGAIRLLRNAENLGFVRSVNRGMEAAGRHDVVLLNSDTEVPRDWLRRLAGHAHSSPTVGTVTPFSNNATICSYPSREGGPLPPGFDLAALDDAFRSANAGRAVDIPTAVGFAMYIRRDCLDAVGAFDAETFGRGYGEENDFCMRAMERGWRHLLACDTFVYHAGSVSFGPNSPLRDRAWNLLVARHPDYPRLVNAHIRLDPAAGSRFAATFNLVRNSGRPAILIVSHHLGGGTTRHVQDLIASAEGEAMMMLLRPSGGGAELSVPSIPGHPALWLSQDQSDALAVLLRQAGVRRVHIHHVLDHTLDLRHVIERLGVPFDITVHDYFALCPRITMVDPRTGTHCGEPSESDCNGCIALGHAADATDIRSWRKRHHWLFEEAERIICPSADAARRLEHLGIRAPTLVVPHDSQRVAPPRAPAPPPAEGEPLRIALLGMLPPHKGATVAAALLQAARPGEIDVTLIGATAPSFALPPGLPFRQTGPYREEDLQDLIAASRPHLICFAALWPETYSYTLSAALEAGLPIVAADIGAFPERLAGHPSAWLVPPAADPAVWLEALRAVREVLSAGAPPAASVPRKVVEAFYPRLYLAPLRGSPAVGPAPAARSPSPDLPREAAPRSAFAASR